MEIIPILVFLIIFDLIGRGAWISFYFSGGIPLFYKKIEKKELTSKKVNEKILYNLHRSKLKYNQISDSQIIFRESMFDGFGSKMRLSMLHGNIIESDYDVKIFGYANMTFLLFLAGYVFFIINFRDLMMFSFSLLFILFWIVLYIMDYSDYKAIFQCITEYYSGDIEKI